MLTRQSDQGNSLAEVPSFQVTLSCIKLILNNNQHKIHLFENLTEKEKNNGGTLIFLFLSLFLQWVWFLLLLLPLNVRFLLLQTLEFDIFTSSMLGPLGALTSEGSINGHPDSDDYSFLDWAVLLEVAMEHFILWMC